MKLLQELDRRNVRINDLKEKNEFLMKRDNKCQMLEQVIDKALKYIQNNILGIDVKTDNIMINRKQLLDILKEVE